MSLLVSASQITPLPRPDLGYYLNFHRSASDLPQICPRSAIGQKVPVPGLMPNFDPGDNNPQVHTRFPLYAPCTGLNPYFDPADNNPQVHTRFPLHAPRDVERQSIILFAA